MLPMPPPVIPWPPNSNWLATVTPGELARLALPLAVVGAVTACMATILLGVALDHIGAPRSPVARGILLTVLGLTLAWAAALPVLFLTRAWRIQLLAAGTLFLGGLAGVLTFSFGSAAGFDERGAAIALGVGLGAGLGLGLGLARRTLSSLIGGLLLGQLAGIPAALAGRGFLGELPWKSGVSSPGLAAGVFFGILYLLLLPGLALVEHLADRLSTREKPAEPPGG